MFTLSIILFLLAFICMIIAIIGDESSFFVPMFIFCVFGSLCLSDYNTNTYKPNKDWHYNGEFIEIANGDTLVVNRANYMNKLYKELEPKDSLQENNIIEQCTVPIKGNVLVYDKAEYELRNKVDNLNVHLSNDTIFIDYP